MKTMILTFVGIRFEDKKVDLLTQNGI